MLERNGRSAVNLRDTWTISVDQGAPAGRAGAVAHWAPFSALGATRPHAPAPRRRRAAASGASGSARARRRGH
jgi:hypothetical protein